MPNLRNYDIFISHAWKYGDDYYRLVNLLQNAPYFKYRNFSVPQHDPLAPPGTPIGDVLLAQKLEAQIRPVQCVLVIAGMYAAHRFWIDKEIAFAQSYYKPIIGIEPWGSQRVPESVKAAANAMVGWNTAKIVEAIRHWALTPR